MADIPFSLPPPKPDQSLVPRSEYDKAVAEAQQRDPYDPQLHNGIRNPYTHRRITCADEYYEYQRENVYHALCDQAAFKHSLTYYAQCHEELLLEDQENQQLKKQMQDMEAQHRRQLRKGFAAFLLCLAVVVVSLLSVYVPAREEASYSSGQATGYAAGENAGYSAGFAEGEDSGYSTGYAEGEDSGYSAGYAAGETAAYGSGYSAGYSAGSTVAASPSPSSGSVRSTGSSSSTASNATTPKSGVDADTTVYVSTSGHKIHLKSNCSGMKYYDTMTYAEACAAGYTHCSKCF